MKPSDFHINPNNIGMALELVSALHKAELEFAATLIIHYHQQKKFEDWVPTSRTEIANFMRDDVTSRRWAQNPFWRPDPHGLLTEGYVEGWDGDPDTKGVFTLKFFDAVQESRERATRRPPPR